MPLAVRHANSDPTTNLNSLLQAYGNNHTRHILLFASFTGADRLTRSHLGAVVKYQAPNTNESFAVFDGDFLSAADADGSDVVQAAVEHAVRRGCASYLVQPAPATSHMGAEQAAIRLLTLETAPLNAATRQHLYLLLGVPAPIV